MLNIISVWIKVFLEKWSLVMFFVFVILNKIIMIVFENENLIKMLIISEVKYNIKFLMVKIWKIFVLVMLISWNKLIFLLCCLIKIVFVYNRKIEMMVISKIEVVWMVVFFLMEFLVVLRVGLYWSVIKVKYKVVLKISVKMYK